MTVEKKYAAKDFSKLGGLNGISDGQIAEHLELYKGYVKRTNALTERLYAMCSEGKASGADPVYAELTRRLGFEYNGMILHEQYFASLRPGATAEPASGSALQQAIVKSFGSFKVWSDDFRAIATMPGVGWAVTYQDPTTLWLSNHWITLHNDGNPSGFTPIVVMDGWEHAFMRDYKAFERGKYVEAFFRNIDWDACGRRLR